MKPLKLLILVLGLGLITSCGPMQEQASFETNAVLNDGTDVPVHVWTNYEAYMVGAGDSVRNQVQDAIRDRLLQADYPELLNDATPIMRDALKSLPRTDKKKNRSGVAYTLTNVVISIVPNTTDTIRITLYQ